MPTTTISRPVLEPAATPVPAPRRTRRARVPAPAGPLRLTRRGRVLLVLVLLALLLIGGFVAGRATSSHAATASTASTVVQPGDTLWSIAARVAPDRDTRIVVSQLRAVNHLSGASVQVGQRLLLPS